MSAGLQEGNEADDVASSEAVPAVVPGTSVIGSCTQPGLSPAVAAPAIHSPPTIPDYKLIRRIGQGSYGEVWLGRGALGQYRAIKIVHRSSFDQDKPYEREFEGLKRFEPVSHARESQVDILHVGRN